MPGRRHNTPRCSVDSWLDASPAVAAAVERAVMRSFETRPLPIRGITSNECRRRVQICERIWKALRMDKSWSLQRACDHLYRYLVADLDGVHWEPDGRSLWAPDHESPTDPTTRS